MSLAVDPNHGLYYPAPMLDLHCHLLPGLDDGAPDEAAALAIARALEAAGYHAVAPSPHFGEGPGGDVPRSVAAEAREALQQRLRQEGIALELLPNAEHHVTAELFNRLACGDVTPVGGDSRWLLVELPWFEIPRPEDVFFRLQSSGYKLLLAHPERYNYLGLDVIERLVHRGVKMQLELGSFVKVYGRRALDRAKRMAERGWVHVLGSDLHRPEQAQDWLAEALKVFAKKYGAAALTLMTETNPQRLVEDVGSSRVHSWVSMD